MSCDSWFFVALPHGAMGWSAVCDCGISWSYQCFFSAVFGAEIQPHSPRQKVCCFSPILKENSPQNEVFKKKQSAKCDNSVLEVHINSFRALAMPSICEWRPLVIDRRFQVVFSRASKGEVPIVTSRTKCRTISNVTWRKLINRLRRDQEEST